MFFTGEKSVGANISILTVLTMQCWIKSAIKLEICNVYLSPNKMCNKQFVVVVFTLWLWLIDLCSCLQFCIIFYCVFILQVLQSVSRFFISQCQLCSVSGFYMYLFSSLTQVKKCMKNVDTSRPPPQTTCSHSPLLY